MADKPELTTTIHLSALRSVPKPRPLEELYSQLSSEERTVVANLPLGSAMLIAIAGASKGSRFLIDQPLTSIGRATDADIFLDDVTVSRAHATLTHEVSGEYIIKDLESLNGTYLNGAAISESRLATGDEIQVGKFRLTLFIGKGK